MLTKISRCGIAESLGLITVNKFPKLNLPLQQPSITITITITITVKMRITINLTSWTTFLHWLFHTPTPNRDPGGNKMGELPTVRQPISCRRSFRSGSGQAPLGAKILGTQPEATDKGATPKIGKNQVDPKSGCPNKLVQNWSKTTQYSDQGCEDVGDSQRLTLRLCL
jgi:hypothetical protein